MSHWAVFRANEGDEVHVLPVTAHGDVVNQHEVHTRCWCKPRRDDAEPQVVVHEDRERGGYDG